MTRTALLAIPLFFSACMLGPDYERPELDLPAEWQAILAQPVAGDPDDSVEWWRVLDDPVLDELIERSFRQNLTVQAAGLRIVQARAGESFAFQTLFPAIVADASAARVYYSQEVRPDVDVSIPTVDVKAAQKQSPKLTKFLQNFLPTVTKDGELDVQFADHVNVFSGGLNAIWELDLFGKTRRRIEASNAELAATIGLYDAVLVSVAGEVASTYILIRTAQTQLDVARAHVAALESVLAATERRGDSTAEIETHLVRSVLRDSQANQLALERALREAEDALCILLGDTGRETIALLSERRPIPGVPLSVALGVPADLLRRRPDLRAAEWLAAAECARIGVARARAVAPSFKLLGSLGVAASKISDLDSSDAVTAAYGGGIGWNILLYPWLQEQVRIQDAQYEESILRYKDTVLRAVKEVETASVALVKAKAQVPLLEESAQASRDAYGLAAERYDRGDLQFPWLMDAIGQRLRQEQREAMVRGEAAQRLIAVYRALGGGWQVREGKPFVPEEIKARMRERTDWWTFSGDKHLDDEITR